MTTSNVLFVSYPNGGVTNQRIVGKTPQQILDIYKTMYQELANATVQVDGDKVTFVVPQGSKA